MGSPVEAAGPADDADLAGTADDRDAADHQDLQGLRVVVTAGGTREALDPVRFLGNRSSGKQGIAIAEAAAARGAEVVLVAGAIDIPPPEHPRIQTRRIESALELQDEMAGLLDSRLARRQHAPADEDAAQTA